MIIKTETRRNTTSKNQLATFTISLSQLEQSVFLNIKPEDYTVSYLLVLKFGQVPFVSSSSSVYDSFVLFCSNKGKLHVRSYDRIFKSKRIYFLFLDLIVGPGFSYYLYFSDPGDNFNLATSLSYGLRELDANEYQKYCVNSATATQPPVSINTTSFTADYEVRAFSSGCYYLDSATGNWLSDGLVIQSDTVLEATHCKSPTLPKLL